MDSTERNAAFQRIEERLTHPIIHLPLEVTEAGARRLRSPDLFFRGLDMGLTHLLVSERLSGPTPTAFTYLYFPDRAYPHHSMPFQMESLKIAERAAFPLRSAVVALGLASAAVIISGFWILLALGYEKGVTTANINPGIPAAFGNEPFNRLVNWLRQPQGPHIPLLEAMAGSFLFTLGLMGLRTPRRGLPFHPAGYVISASTLRFLVVRIVRQKTFLPLPLSFTAKCGIIGNHPQGAAAVTPRTSEGSLEPDGQPLGRGGEGA